MKKFKYVVLTAMLAMSMAGCGSSNSNDGDSNNTTSSSSSSVILQEGLPEIGEEIAIVTTSLGEIKLRFYPDEAPLAVENFKELAKSDYYDGIIFHRVIDDFMIQGGDPTGTGTGGASYFGSSFEDEISPNLHFFKGALAMANSGPNTNGSQFFIVQNPVVNELALDAIREKRDDASAEEPFTILINGESYPIGDIFPETVLEYYQNNGGHVELEYVFGGAYTIFGQAFDGLDIVDKISGVVTDDKDKPLEDIVIFDINITEFNGLDYDYGTVDIDEEVEETETEG